MFSENMEELIEKFFILILIIFGLMFSFYLFLYSGAYTAFVFILITIGLSSTLYILDKKINYKIIFYIWIAIIVIAILTLVLELAFKTIILV